LQILDYAAYYLGTLVLNIHKGIGRTGINNKLKLLKRLGYGFRNFANSRLRCLLSWHFSVKYS
jgi:hypothetical protein